MQYQLIKDEDGTVRADTVNRTDESGIVSSVPNDSDNRDWQAYQDWLAAGNAPLPPG